MNESLQSARNMHQILIVSCITVFLFSLSIKSTKSKHERAYIWLESVLQKIENRSKNVEKDFVKKNFINTIGEISYISSDFSVINLNSSINRDTMSVAYLLDKLEELNTGQNIYFESSILYNVNKECIISAIKLINDSLLLSIPQSHEYAPFQFRNISLEKIPNKRGRNVLVRVTWRRTDEINEDITKLKSKNDSISRNRIESPRVVTFYCETQKKHSRINLKDISDYPIEKNDLKISRIHGEHYVDIMENISSNFTIDENDTSSVKVIEMISVINRIKDLTINKAIVELQRLIEEDKLVRDNASLEIVGLKIQSRPAIIVAPAILFIMALYLLVLTIHILRISKGENEVIIKFPWLALFNDFISKGMFLVSIFILPLGTSAYVAYRFGLPKNEMVIAICIYSLFFLSVSVAILLYIFKIQKQLNVKSHS